MTADNQSPTCLFFDSNGNGPSELRIIKREIREVVEDGQTVVPRAFGLCWEVTGALHFVEDGGIMLDTEVATWLRDKLTAWLDAPRLAARETAEVVATGADLIAAGDTDGPGSPHECPKCCGWTVYEADDTTGGGQ